jgi:hypothetical protein
MTRRRRCGTDISTPFSDVEPVLNIGPATGHQTKCRIAMMSAILVPLSNEHRLKVPHPKE